MCAARCNEADLAPRATASTAHGNKGGRSDLQAEVVTQWRSLSERSGVRRAPGARSATCRPLRHPCSTTSWPDSCSKVQRGCWASGRRHRQPASPLPPTRPPPAATAMASPPGLDPSRAVNAPAFVPGAPPGLAPTAAAAVTAKPFVPGGSSSGGAAAAAVTAKPFVPGGSGSNSGLAKSASSSSLTSGAVHAPIFVPGAALRGR